MMLMRLTVTTADSGMPELKVVHCETLDYGVIRGLNDTDGDRYRLNGNAIDVLPLDGSGWEQRAVLGQPNMFGELWVFPSDPALFTAIYRWGHTAGQREALRRDPVPATPARSGTTHCS